MKNTHPLSSLCVGAKHKEILTSGQKTGDETFDKATAAGVPATPGRKKCTEAARDLNRQPGYVCIPSQPFHTRSLPASNPTSTRPRHAIGAEAARRPRKPKPGFPKHPNGGTHAGAGKGERTRPSVCRQERPQLQRPAAPVLGPFLYSLWISSPGCVFVSFQIPLPINL